MIYSTLGITEDAAQQSDSQPPAKPAPNTARHLTATKQEALIAMLRAAGGTITDEVVAAAGWLPHTAKGAMSCALTKKLGLSISADKVEGPGRCYKIPPA